MWGRMIFGKGSQKCLSKISVNSLKHFKDLKFSRSSVDHSQQGELTCFHGCLGWIHGYKEPAVQKEYNFNILFIDNFNIFWGHRQLFKLDGLHPNKLGARVLKDNFYFSLHHPSVVCANPLIHSPGQNMSDHRTSYQLPSHYVVEESHKDTDNATQPKQALLMDIPAEPCPQSSSHADCDVLQQLHDSALKDDFLENSLGSQDNTSPETPELEPRSPDTLSLSPASSLLSFSQKMEELVYAGTKLSTSPQISTKKRRAPQPPKTAGSALPPPPVRALQPLPQRKGPNPPPSAVGEPKTTDNSSQWYVSGPRYISSNIHKRLQNKREPSMPVAFSISVLLRDRRSKAFSSRTADPSNLRPVMHQSKIAVETKCNSIKLAFLNTRSLKWFNNHKQPGFYVSNWNMARRQLQCNSPHWNSPS